MGATLFKPEGQIIRDEQIIIMSWYDDIPT